MLITSVSNSTLFPFLVWNMCLTAVRKVLGGRSTPSLGIPLGGYFIEASAIVKQ